MGKLYKDENDNVVSISSVNGFVPPGYTELPAEEVEAAELDRARSKKMTSVRAQRDGMMLVHDKKYMIALKDSADTADLLADRTALLDLPAAAQAAVDALETKEEIDAYDAFDGLSLNEDYE